VTLLSTAEILEALVARAEHGRDSAAALRLGELTSARMRTARGIDSLSAIDEVLWQAISSLDPSYLLAGRRAKHTSESLLCCLSIFARLDVRALLASDPVVDKDRAFPGLSLKAGSRREAAERDYATVYDYDRDGPWRLTGESKQSVWAAMCAALSLAERGAIEKYCQLAAVLLAAEILRNEALNNSSSATTVTGPLRDVEILLDERGLLTPYSSTPMVRDELDRLLNVMEVPLRGFTEPVADFGFVIRQLDTTFHSLKGVMVYQDTKVNQNDDYFERQLEVLVEHGITIERAFIYEDENEPKVRELEKRQRTLAEAATASCPQDDLYKPYLVSSKFVRAMGQELPSFVIIDYDEPTARVVTQSFGPLEQYRMSAHPTDVRRKAEEFKLLMDHADSPA
jgi:hypothetical protein